MTTYNYLSFDGVDDEVNFGKPADFKPASEDISISVFCNIQENTGAGQQPFNADGSDLYTIEIHEDDEIRVRTAGTGPNVSFDSYNENHIIGFTRDRSGGLHEVYFDGVNVGGDATATNNLDAPTDDAHIGKKDAGVPDWLKGKVYSMTIYSEPLTASQMLYNSEHPYNPLRKGLILSLGPGGISGSTWSDESTNSNDGTITGATIISGPQKVNRLEVL